MPPTDTTRTSVRTRRRSHRTKSTPACQEGVAKAAPLGPQTAHAILLLNFDPPHREGHTVALRRCGYKVFIPEEHGTSLARLTDDELRHVEYVLFDLTHLNYDDVFLHLRRLCRLRNRDGMPVHVTCLSRTYRGPAFQRIVEKLGARLVYAG